jgi:uncharacterized protein
MQINVSQQLKASTGYVREYDIAEVMDILGLDVSSLIEGKVKLTRTNRGILVQGKLYSKVPVECSRCLKTFDYPLTINIEEEFFPVIDVNTGIPLELPEESGDFIIDEHHILDLSEAIRQNALLAVPMKPLCREDCAGLCVTCGKNMNESPCDCSREEMDPRWSKLVELASEAKKKNKRKKENK